MSDIEELARCALNLAVWTEDILDGSHSEWSPDDKIKIKDDIDELYEVLGSISPATYRAWTEYERNGPLWNVFWYVERNGAPFKAKRAPEALPKFEGDDRFRWLDGKTRQAQLLALEILLAEGYDLDEARQSYIAFARDVIGNFEKGEPNILTSDMVKEWVDEFEVSSSTSSGSETEEGEDGQEQDI